MWRILLHTTKLAEELEAIMEALTNAEEQLAVLQIRGELLKKNWQGTACDAWLRELQERLSGAEKWIQEMRRLLFLVQEAAKELIVLEEKNRQRAEALGG